MKKDLKIIIPAIVVVIVAIVGVLLVVNNNQTEQVKGTITEVVKTTLKEIITTEEETSETETLTENTEEVAEPTQSITKTPETTKKTVSNSSVNSSSSVATIQKPTATAQPQVTEFDINTIDTTPTADFVCDIRRAGLYYTFEGNLTTYDEIPYNTIYFYYDSNGYRQRSAKKPNTAETSYENQYCVYCGYCLIGITPNSSNTCPSCTKRVEKDDYGSFCEDCGKSSKGVTTLDGVWTPPHELGGCSQFSMDTECDKCGKIVPAYTCFHGCGISH